MISRRLIRSSHAPWIQTHTAPLRIAPSRVWTRSVAYKNKAKHEQQNASHLSGPSRSDYSNPSGGSAVSSSSVGSSRNSNLSQQDQSALNCTRNQGQGEGEQLEYSSKQVGFDNKSSPMNSNAPPTSSLPTSNLGESKARNQPLPDLTRGIPSTLQFETMGSTNKSGTRHLNLTETDGSSTESSGGRGRGELPASAYISSSERNRLRVANYMYALFFLFSITGTVYLGRNWDSEEEENAHPNAPSGWALGLMWSRARARLGDELNYYSEPAFPKLLPDVDPMFERPYTLVLSLEDLLIHSEWSREYGWRLAKRPGVDYFLRYLSQYFELVVFTTQPSQFAEPVIRKLDPYHIIMWPLFREATLYENGEYVKDLSYLNRDLSKVIIIDTNESHVKKQRENAIVLKPWEGDVNDKELVSLIPFLEYIHTMAYTDVRKAIKSFDGHHIPTEFARREAISRQKFQAEFEAEQKKRPKRSGVGFLGNALGIKHQSMMMDPQDQNPAEAFAQGKMLQDQARERGQRNYELLEKEIRENGEKWLKEEAAFEERAKEEGMKAMKSGFTSWFGGGSSSNPEAK